MLEAISSDFVSRVGALGRSLEVSRMNEECRANGHPNSEKTYQDSKTNRIRMKCKDCGAIHYKKATIQPSKDNYA